VGRELACGRVTAARRGGSGVARIAAASQERCADSLPLSLSRLLVLLVSIVCLEKGESVVTDLEPPSLLLQKRTIRGLMP
jgi:hypothetical protein